MRRRRKALGITAALIAAPFVLGVAAWGYLAIPYVAPADDDLKPVLAAAYGVLGLAGLIGLFWRRLRAATFALAAALVLVVVWFRQIEASNDRDWQPEVAKLAYAEINGDLVTIHNIRNFDYRTETDFTPRYYDRTFDLSKLDSADIIACYWMGDAIAHLMVSFGFAGEQYLTISIETRKEKGESYSTVSGFFRQFELYYVVADERDAIRVRTNYRKDPPEDVYLYRTDTPPDKIRRIFLDYVREINSLHRKAAFYNTATTNCTTNIWMHTRVNTHAWLPNWKILVSGYAPELIYERGRLDSRLPFEELKRRSHIDEAALAADTAEDFSQRIRANVPKP